MRSLSLFALLFAGTIGALAAPLTTTAPGTVTVKTPSQGSYVGQRSDVADEVRLDEAGVSKTRTHKRQALITHSLS